MKSAAQLRDEPIERVEWIGAQDLRPNTWNPNVVYLDELRLLELSIATTGWTQPILVSRTLLIIDGYHRWRLAQEPRLDRIYNGLVPCVRLDLDDAEAMLLTVRMNRAKGQHVALRMAELVGALLNVHRYDEQEIARGIGGTVDEVRLLAQADLFKARNLDRAPYSPAWVPRETTIHGEPNDD